jgi:hypothetical protein
LIKYTISGWNLVILEVLDSNHRAEIEKLKPRRGERTILNALNSHL